MVPVPDSPRFFCDAPLTSGAVVSLPERAARHVAVLRLKVGDAVTLFSGDGNESSGTLVQISKRGVVAAVRNRRAADRESPLVIHLAQSVCAGDKMDFVLQKATELGVATIQPLVTQRSIVRISGERQEQRKTHWQNVVVAACEQCGRNRIPPVMPTLAFADFLERPTPEGTRVVLVPDGDRSLREITPIAPITVLVGPEGGLTGDERALAVEAGFLAIRFGPRILRSESAPLAALAALQALYGDC